MIAMNMKAEVKGATRYLDSVQKKQVPFATARALTWTAKKAQGHIQGKIPSFFNVTRRWWLAKQPTGIKVKPATKAALVAIVYTKAYFAKLQEEGGIKLPFRGKGLLIPSPRVPKYGRKAGGAVKVLAGKRILRRGGKAGGDPVVHTLSGSRGVFRRRGKKRLPVDLLYSYKPSAHIKPRMNFKVLAARVAKAEFKAEFNKSLGMALKTAK